jgi:thiamine-phosphate diphosphorylase
MKLPVVRKRERRQLTVMTILFLSLFRFLLSSPSILAPNFSHAWIQKSSEKRLFRQTSRLANTRAAFDDATNPFLALVTPFSAYDDDHSFQACVDCIRAIQSNVDLIYVRVPNSARVVDLLRTLVDECDEGLQTAIVVSSDCVDAAITAGAHGVHVKEHHRSLIPEIRAKYIAAGLREPIIGTSAHSINSALEAYRDYQVDYLFVGTCYYSMSHPEKLQVEGPELPGQVCRRLLEEYSVDETELLQQRRLPNVFAIGGIDETNCHEPVAVYGADGVAVIRAVFGANDPQNAVERIKANMSGAKAA